MTTINNETPPHQGRALAGRTLEWLPVDTAERYAELSQNPEYRAYFEQQGWNQPGAITYRINSLGFRGDEFGDGIYLMALGCSYTLGTGLPEDKIWPSLLAKRMGLQCANLAWGGYSSDSCYRLAEYWIHRLRPAYVCMLAPPVDRLEILTDPDYLATDMDVLLPAAMSSGEFQHDRFVRHWFLNPENGAVSKRKNIRALRWLCHEFGIPCMVLDSAKYMSRSREEIGYARDRMHGGLIVHEELARLFEDGYKHDKS